MDLVVSWMGILDHVHVIVPAIVEKLKQSLLQELNPFIHVIICIGSLSGHCCACPRPIENLVQVEWSL